MSKYKQEYARVYTYMTFFLVVTSYNIPLLAFIFLISSTIDEN